MVSKNDCTDCALGAGAGYLTYKGANKYSNKLKANYAKKVMTNMQNLSQAESATLRKAVVDAFEVAGLETKGCMLHNVNPDNMKSMDALLTKNIKDRIMKDCFKEVQFVLYGKGKKTCNNLIIEVRIKGDNIHVYTADSRQVKNDKHDVEPDKNDLDRSVQFYAFFPNDREDYEYGEWNLQSQPETIRYTCQTFVSGCPKTDVVKPIYVDTRYEQSIIVGIKINGTDIPEGGVKEELLIKVG